MTRRILIVDDSATIRKMVRASLRHIAGAEFVEAANGLAAIEQLALGVVALIVLDLNMPELHGVDVLKFVRGHQAFKDVPVLVLTTRGDDASRDAAIAAGATLYLTKPFLPQTLLARASELMAGVVDQAGRGDR